MGHWASCIPNDHDAIGTCTPSRVYSISEKVNSDSLKTKNTFNSSSKTFSVFLLFPNWLRNRWSKLPMSFTRWKLSVPISKTGLFNPSFLVFLQWRRIHCSTRSSWRNVFHNQQRTGKSNQRMRYATICSLSLGPDVNRSKLQRRTRLQMRKNTSVRCIAGIFSVRKLFKGKKFLNW